MGLAALAVTACGVVWRAISGSRARAVNLEAVVIREVSAQDLLELEGLFPCTSASVLPGIQTAVQRGSVSVATAWMSGRPAGIALAAWDGPRAPEARLHWPHCPEIYCVEVLESIRREGIGTRLVAACEGLAVQRGFSTVGVGVALDNIDAYALYLRLGYAERGRIEYASPASTDGGADGATASAAPLRFLVKPLQGFDSTPMPLTLTPASPHTRQDTP